MFSCRGELYLAISCANIWFDCARGGTGGVGHIGYGVRSVRLGGGGSGGAILRYDTQIWSGTWAGTQLSTCSRKVKFRPCQTSTGRRLASIFDEPWRIGRKSVVGLLACRTALQCCFGTLDRRFQVLHHSCLLECVVLFCRSVLATLTTSATLRTESSMPAPSILQQAEAG